LAAKDLPEQVTIALRELAGAAKEGLLAFSVASGSLCWANCLRPNLVGWRDQKASTIPIDVRIGMGMSLAR